MGCVSSVRLTISQIEKHAGRLGHEILRLVQREAARLHGSRLRQAFEVRERTRHLARIGRGPLAHPKLHERNCIAHELDAGAAVGREVDDQVSALGRREQHLLHRDGRRQEPLIRADLKHIDSVGRR
jgi:hypothetical protein